MFLQGITTRVAMIITVLTIGVTGMAYGVGHLSDTVLIFGFPEANQAGQIEGPVAYLIDPVHRLYIPYEPPFESGLPMPANQNYLANEPGVLYLGESIADSEQQTTTARFYRYDPRNGEGQIVYENVLEQTVMYGTAGFWLWKSPDNEYYAFWDLWGRRLVAINTRTLESHIVWQDELRQYQGYVGHNVSWSPDGERIAFLYDDPDPQILVVTVDGAILNRIPTDPFIRRATIEVEWLADNRHVLLANRYGGTLNIIRVYDTISGQVNPYTSSLEGVNTYYLNECQHKGDWISFAKDRQQKVIYLLNLTTGEMHEIDVSYDPSPSWSTYLWPTPDCSPLVHIVTKPPQNNLYAADVYLTSLNGERPRKVLSNVYTGSFDDEGALIYAQPNENQKYDVYRLLLDGSDRSELLTPDVPSAYAFWTNDLIERGWYVFKEDEWERPDSVMPPLAGNPLIYYDMKSGKARVLPPSDVSMSYFVELP